MYTSQHFIQKKHQVRFLDFFTILPFTLINLVNPSQIKKNKLLFRRVTFNHTDNYWTSFLNDLVN